MQISTMTQAASQGRHRQARGFTLIELMTVVAVIGILSALAMPSYRDYILRGQLVDATNLLSAGQANMERYFQDNRQYSATGSNTPPCATSSTLGKFTLTCTTAANTYLMTATGSGPTAAFSYTVDQTNSKQTFVATGAPAGWTTPSPNTCWLLKKGQPC